MTQSTGMFCIRSFFHQPRLPKLGPFVEMPWTRCNLVTGHNRIRSEPRWMSGECEEVDKWLRPQILINLFEVRSPQAMNLVNRNRVTVKRTITHVMGRKRKKPGLFFNSCRFHVYGCRREVFFFWGTWFDLTHNSGDRQESDVDQKMMPPSPPVNVCV